MCTGHGPSTKETRAETGRKQEKEIDDPDIRISKYKGIEVQAFIQGTTINREVSKGKERVEERSSERYGVCCAQGR